MKAGEIMNRAPVTVRTDQTFGEAFRVLIESRQATLPCVDGSGVYKGLFDLKDIWDVLLPKAAQLSRKSIEDLSFVSGSVERMKERLAEAAGLPVTRFLTADDAPPLHTDSPAMQAAVVERGSGKLAGVVSPWHVLDALR